MLIMFVEPDLGLKMYQRKDAEDGGEKFSLERTRRIRRVLNNTSGGPACTLWQGIDN